MARNCRTRSCATRLSGPQIHAAYLNIDGRRSALIQHGIHQAARLKVGAQLGEFAGDPSRTSSM